MGTKAPFPWEPGGNQYINPSGYAASQHPTQRKGAGYGASQHPTQRPAPSIPSNAVVKPPKFVDSVNEHLSEKASKVYGPEFKNYLPPTDKVKTYDGGSGVSGVAVDPNKATNDMLDSMYATLTGQVNQTGQNNAALYDAALKAIEGNYAKSQGDQYNQYAGSRDSLTGAAKNLGVDFQGSSLGQGYDVALRRIAEMSDSNLNSDQSYLEKMKGLDQQGISSLLTGIQQELVNRKATAAADALALRSGGGRGGRGGGGGGSSKSKTSGTATETMTSDNVGDKALYDELAKSDPDAASTMLRAYQLAEGDPSKAVAQLMQTPVKKSFFNPANILKNVTTSKNNTKAISQLMALTPYMGNNKVKQVVTQKGKS